MNSNENRSVNSFPEKPGDVAFTFLGTGTSTGVPQIGCDCEVCKSKNPKDRRLRCAALIEISGIKILIDAGPDMRQQLLTNNVSHLDGILITHEHYDHIGGIDDIRPFGKTTIYCEHRVAEKIYKNLDYCFAPKKYPGVPRIDLTEISEDDFYVKGIKVTPIRIMHANLPILGYRIGDVAYLTDVKAIPECSYEKLIGLKMLVINALRIEEHPSHINLEEAVEIAKRINAETTYLTHFSHQIGLHDKINAQLPKNIYMAYDNLSINL